MKNSVPRKKLILSVRIKQRTKQLGPILRNWRFWLNCSIEDQVEILFRKVLKATKMFQFCITKLATCYVTCLLCEIRAFTVDMTPP